MPKHHKHRSQGSGFYTNIYTYTYRHRVWKDLAMILVSSVCFPSLLKPLYSGNSLDDYLQVNKNLYVGYVGRTTFKPWFNMQDLTFSWG